VSSDDGKLGNSKVSKGEVGVENSNPLMATLMQRKEEWGRTKKRRQRLPKPPQVDSLPSVSESHLTMRRV